MDFETRLDQTALNRLAYHTTGLQVVLAALKLQHLCGKAGFRPDQPRVPRGDPDGGQWTRIGGDARIIPAGGEFDDPLDDFSADDDLQELLNRLDIPEVRPGSLSESYAIVRRIPVPLFARRPGQSISEFLDALGAPKWLREYYPHIEAYRAPPRSLRELQADALEPKPGYDIHHIVERKPSLGEGFPRSIVDGPENLVRIAIQALGDHPMVRDPQSGISVAISARLSTGQKLG